MVLLYFSYIIIVANILILSVGYVANIAFIGSFLGGLMAIGTDPIILILGALLGAGLVANKAPSIRIIGSVPIAIKPPKNEPIKAMLTT